MGCVNERPADPGDKDPDKGLEDRISARPPPLKDSNSVCIVDEGESEDESEESDDQEILEAPNPKPMQHKKPEGKFVQEPDVSKFREAMEVAKNLNYRQLHPGRLEKPPSQSNLNVYELSPEIPIKSNPYLNVQSMKRNSQEFGSERNSIQLAKSDYSRKLSSEKPGIVKLLNLETIAQDRVNIKSQKKEYKMEISQTDIEVIPDIEETKGHSESSSLFMTQTDILPIFNFKIREPVWPPLKFYDEGDQLLKLADPVEEKFWKRLYKSSDALMAELRDLVPSYFGITEREGSKYIVLENIYNSRYIKTKIGRVTFTFDMPEEKRNAQAKKNSRTTTRNLGFRITYHHNKDLQAVKRSNVHEYLHELVSENDEVNRLVLNKIIKGINAILDWFKQQRYTIFFGSSVVFTDQGTVKLVGFKHLKDAEGDRDDNFIEGLESLLTFWEKLN